MPQSLPLSWSNDENLLWRVSVGRGSSSPIVADGRIFLTSYSGYGVDPDNPGNREDLRLHVSAYDLETGEQLWDYSFPASEYEQEATQRVLDHGYASPTPCTDGETVFAAFGPSGVVAVDRNGTLKWRRDVGHKTAGFGSAASPILFEGLVIVNASIESGTLFALDKETGKTVWQVDGIDRAWTTPAIATSHDGAHELVIHFKDAIRGIDPRTGQELWRCQGIPDYIVPTPVVTDKVVYFSGGRQNRTVAVRPGGRGDVTDTHRIWDVVGGANVTTPLFHDGILYWAHDKAYAQAMDASSGKILYRERFQNRDRVYASVVFGDGRLYMLLRDGTTLVVAPGREFHQLAVNHLGSSEERFNATPAIVDNSLLIRSTHYLYRVGEP